MYVTSLGIENLRCFASASLTFVHPDMADPGPRLRNVNLLLGDNGAGKTTVLRAIVLAVLGATLSFSGCVPYRLVRRVGGAASDRAEAGVALVAHPQDGVDPSMPMRWDVEIVRRRDFESIGAFSLAGGDVDTGTPDDPAMYDEASPAFFLVAYGSTRRTELSDRFDIGAQEKARRARYRRVATLFEEYVALVPLSHWLPRVQDERPARFAEVKRLFEQLLGSQARFTGAREGSDYLFEVDGNSAPFPALSDGYRAFIGWVGDLLYHLWSCCPEKTALGDMVGVVLVDEIDLHLHPDWQREVVPALSGAFPRLQFVFTSHSPMVTGTLEAMNIQVIETDASTGSRVRRLEERVHGLSSEQILLGSYFNLPSTRAPDAVDELRELSRSAAEDPEAALEFMRTLARGLPEAVREPETPRSRGPRQSKQAGSRKKAGKTGGGAKKAGGAKRAGGSKKAVLRRGR